MPTKEKIEAAETGALPAVNARCLSTERTAFTEEGNEDGWISTALTVDIRP